jgi:hypothetical protein
MESSGTSFIIGFYIVMLLISGLVGYWGGRLARDKGYSFALGFAIGFFGGFLGILILYLINPAARRTERYAPMQYYEPPPAEYNPVLEAPTGVPPYPPPPQAAPLNKVCQQCTNLVPADAQFCTYCGADVSQTASW